MLSVRWIYQLPIERSGFTPMVQMSYCMLNPTMYSVFGMRTVYYNEIPVLLEVDCYSLHTGRVPSLSLHQNTTQERCAPEMCSQPYVGSNQVPACMWCARIKSG